MKWRKLTALLLTASLGFTMLAGCGNKENNETKDPDVTDNDKTDDKEGDDKEVVELSIAVHEGGYGRAYWDAVAEAFEKQHEGVKVVIQSSPEIGEVIRPQILAGNVPDFIYLPSSNASGVTTALIKDKALADISDVMEKVKDKIIPGFLDTKSCKPYDDGKIYLAPMYYSTMGLWYNKDYFEKNNLEVPVTWDDFFALGDKVTDRALFTYQGLYPGYLESMVIPAIASAAGADVMESCFNYDETAWQTPEVKAVLANIAKIGTGGYLMEGTVALDHTQAQGQWLLGKAMFHPNGSWVEGEMADAPKEDGFEYGFAAPPVLDANGDKAVYTAVEEIFIPAAAKHVDLAKEFLEFQYSDEAVKLNAELAKGIPPVVGAAELIKEVASPAVYESYTIFDKGYVPYVGNFAPVEETEIIPKDELYNPIGDVMSGKLSVDDWIAKMVDMCKAVQDKVVK